jgi:antitoxin component YwqK of YwqJK toxin-antitoxin module
MMRFLFLLILLLRVNGVYCQVTIPFEFISEEENHLIKENDSVKFFIASGDSANTVSINEEASYYKLFNRDRRVIAEGPFIAEGDKYLQDGKWTAYFNNGKIKVIGYYKRNMPVGTWQEFYSSGKPKVISNYAIFIDRELITCMSGSYQEYYPTGKLKVSGFYAAEAHKTADTLLVEDPVSGETKKVVQKHNDLKPVKTGRWEYYTEEGELDKKEEF